MGKMPKDSERTAKSYAVIAIIAALGVLGVLAITIVSIPIQIQQAEAVHEGGCGFSQRFAIPYIASETRCFNPAPP